MRPPFRLLALLALPLFFCAAGKKTEMSVRVFTEGNKQDTESFSTPIKVENPRPHEIYIDKIPWITERNIRAMYPFRANDGTWGCAFKLDEIARLRLETISTDRRGTSMVVVFATKTGVHQVADLVIDAPVKDGVFSVPRGISDLELVTLRKQFHLWVEKPEPKPKNPLM